METVKKTLIVVATLLCVAFVILISYFIISASMIRYENYKYEKFKEERTEYAKEKLDSLGYEYRICEECAYVNVPRYWYRYSDNEGKWYIFDTIVENQFNVYKTYYTNSIDSIESYICANREIVEKTVNFANSNNIGHDMYDRYILDNKYIEFKKDIIGVGLMYYR